MAEIPTEWVSLQVADGTTMRAYVARPPKTPPRAGLLVFQEAFGVNAHIRDITERFAREGFPCPRAGTLPPHRAGLRGCLQQLRGGHAPRARH